MDEIRHLEQEINALQTQLRQQNAEAARVRQSLIDDNRRNLESYQADMRRAIRDHDSDTQAEYERLLRQYQNSLSADVQVELAKMDADYSRLLNDVKRNEALLLQKNQELEQAIVAIRNDASRRNEGSSQEAKEYLQTATSAFHVVEAKPHEKFMPKRLQIFFNAIKDGQQLFKAGLYEAATAVAISAKSGLERLGYSIDDKVEEWDKQFDLFMLKLNYLQNKIQQELVDWEQYTGDPSNGNAEIRTRHLIAINFWCRGEFANTVQTAKKYQKYVSTFSQVGKEAYLKQPDSPSVDDLKKFIEEIGKTDQRLSELSELYKRRYAASCERSEWGEEIIDFLTTEINLEWLEHLTGFKEAAPEVLVSKDFLDFIKSQYGDLTITEDMREWLKIVFENSSENKIYVYILPLEAHGIVVNHIILHIDYGGPEQEMYSRDIYQHICEAIQLTDESDGIVNYAADVNELKVSENKVYSETGKDLERMKRQNI